jgi:hypothetical protein
MRAPSPKSAHRSDLSDTPCAHDAHTESTNFENAPLLVTEVTICRAKNFGVSERNDGLSEQARPNSSDIPEATELVVDAIVSKCGAALRGRPFDRVVSAIGEDLEAAETAIHAIGRSTSTRFLDLVAIVETAARSRHRPIVVPIPLIPAYVPPEPAEIVERSTGANVDALRAVREALLPQTPKEKP